MQKYLILTAVTSEMQPIVSLLGATETVTVTVAGVVCQKTIINDKEIFITACGIGTACTAIVASRLLYALDCAAMFFCGTAGGIANNLKINDIVVATQSYEPEIQGLWPAFSGTSWEVGLQHPVKQTLQPAIFAADADLLQVARAVSSDWKFGIIASTNTFPSPSNLIADIRARGTVAIDMETAALYQLGWMFSVPVLALRCVSNLLQPDGSDPEVGAADPDAAAVYAAKALLKFLNRL